VRHGRNKLLAPALAGLLGLLALPASGALADSGTSLTQLTSFHQMTVDSSAGYIFLSEGGTTGGIVVTNLSGSYVTTLDAGAGVSGLALSSDGGYLYAALTTGTTPGNADSIDVIDVSTVSGTQVAESAYQLGNGDVPGSLAFQNGQLWVSYTGSGGAGGIDSFNPSSDAFAPATTDSWATAPDLAADPRDGGTVVAAEGGANPALAAAYAATSSGTLTVTAGQADLGQCQGEGQLAVVPGGQSFLAACGSTVNEYSLTDLGTPTTTYPAGGTAAVAVAVDASQDAQGTVAAGSSSAAYVDGPAGAAENVFPVGSQASLAAGGLAWEDSAADGSELVAVTADGGGPYSVQVFSQPTVTRSTLSLSQPSTAVAGVPVTLSGTLALSTGAPPAGSIVSIVGKAPDGSTETTAQVTVAADGSFTVTDTPPAAGTYTYAATYSGTAGAIAPASATATVTVTQNAATVTLAGPAQADIGTTVTLTGSVALLGGTLPPGTPVAITRTISGSAAATTATVLTSADGSFRLPQTVDTAGTYTYTATYAGTATIPAATATYKLSVIKIPATLTLSGPASVSYNTAISVTAHLGATYANRTVSVYAQWDGSTSKRLLKTANVNSSGNLTISYTAPHSTTFSVVFGGDAHYAAKTVTRDVGVRAFTATSIGGYYASKKAGGTTYRLFHRSSYLYVTATTAPDKSGQCVSIEVQEYYGGAWHANETTGCSVLNGSSQLYGYLTVTNGDPGYQYRVRADYTRSATDVSNLSTDSGWQYVLVEK
jgi:hypothetical protein